MKKRGYVIYDQVSEVHGEWIFPAINSADARRMFDQFIAKGEARPQDVILYEIGVYDRVTGIFKGYDIPHLIVSGIDVTRKEELTNE